MSRGIHMNESCQRYESFVSHLCISRVAQNWMTHVKNVNGWYHKWMNFTCAWLMSKIWMIDITHMNVSCRTCLERKRASLPLNKWCHSYQWDTTCISHVWMSNIAHVNASCHIYEWVASRIWMSHVKHMKGRETTRASVTLSESCHKYGWVTKCNGSGCKIAQSE